jgi:hypothetical protein
VSIAKPGIVPVRGGRQNKSQMFRRADDVPVYFIGHYVKSLLLLVFLSRRAMFGGPV